ncbi:hypothetical protein [Herbidospora mongoliensis]|uniref:hypothetical protein n=1 Tax=Herbidospora mongoliensis TaxID=688067 RepID=UPI0008353214|nr:hypothetical protein [Herbidospora mongoliensis]
MPSYASVDELATALGREPVTGFTDAERERAELLLNLATGEIDRELGQHLALTTETFTLDGPGGVRLLLPRWPVTEVTAVTVLDQDDAATDLSYPADYRWSTAGIMTLRRGCWPRWEQSIIITLSAGYDPIPDGARAPCLRMAVSAWDNFSGKVSERLGDWQAAWKVAGIALTTQEINAISTYRART